MIYIDPPMWPAHGTLFSHLVSDTSLQELHAFAGRCGISPRAFDGDHYDVPAHRHDELVAAGAVAVDCGSLVRILIASGLRIPARERPGALVRPLMERWHRLLPQHPDLGTALLERWNEPHRRYHDRRHLLQVLEALDLLAGDRVPRPTALAAWFHDAVYAGQAGADEEASARLAEDLLPAAGVSAGEVAETARLVRLTAQHRPADGDDDGALLSDADLAVLSRDPGGYAAYVRDIRAEYAHVPEEAFRQGRRQVLEGLLAADRLYATAEGRRRWEDRARRNLAAELAGLDAPSAPAAAPTPPAAPTGAAPTGAAPSPSAAPALPAAEPDPVPGPHRTRP
ncbi:hypothetical protein BN1051_00578 [Arthrobacter saudimassiliensis]|uniref:DUF4031 domain-containing protein n=1 Tax=Arthrobacter saudimassiliensis TaxID=1461584 RepID=A0A078MQZ2_9MICC|nr:hypothetical protein BN1051_00578 [Arthrobacter saudimassiliensis]